MAKGNQTQIILQQSSLRYRMPQTNHVASNSTNDPNQWFSDKFPEQVEQYGPAFLEGNWTDSDGLKRFIPAYLNEDFFAGMLGGNISSGHQVVYYPPEDAFYFFDYRVEAFCPTTEEKLKLLVSNYLIRCTQECNPLVDITNLVVRFREDESLGRIIEKAKSVLETDRLFFEGKDGQRKCIDGKMVDPSDAPAHELFIKHVIIPEPKGAITLTDCYHKYYRFCRESKMTPPTRTEFQSLVSDAIRFAFNIGLRHDVPGPNGKQVNGWKGISYRQDHDLLMAGRN